MAIWNNQMVIHKTWIEYGVQNKKRTCFDVQIVALQRNEPNDSHGWNKKMFWIYPRNITTQIGDKPTGEHSKNKSNTLDPCW